MAPRLDLYWIPLGAGTPVVRFSGRVYESLIAAAQRRARRDLYHSALVATTGDGPVTIEMTPIPDGDGRRSRGVVSEGAVASRALGRFRVFRYEIRRWPHGTIPDLAFAVASPVLVTEDRIRVDQVLDLVGEVPTPVWGRDELGAGEMWNSNSVVSWVMARADLLAEAGRPPTGGRAPGWDAGIAVAARSTPHTVDP